MKRNWQPEELIDHWTLLPSELALLTKKTATNRLGIALLLKYFQYEGHFPTSKGTFSISHGKIKSGETRHEESRG